MQIPAEAVLQIRNEMMRRYSVFPEYWTDWTVSSVQQVKMRSALMERVYTVKDDQNEAKRNRKALEEPEGRPLAKATSQFQVK